MLGMIFGVAAVVSMMSIGAGAQQQVLAFIEQLGVRNLIVEAREANDFMAFQKARKVSPGLTERDLRVIRANVPGHHGLDGAQALRAAEARAQAAARRAAGLRHRAQLPGDWRPARSSRAASSPTPRRRGRRPVAVIGEGARTNLFGAKDPIGEYVKVNEQWFRVIGMVGPQVSSQTDVAGIPCAGPQQPDLRARGGGHPAARRQLQPLQGRDRRHLPADGRRRRDDPHGRRRCAAS